MGCEEGVRSDQEPGGGLLLLIAENLRVREPGVILDGVVQIRVADYGAVASSGGATDFAVSTAVRDAAEFLDVEVDQVARCIVLVSAGRGPAHRQPGSPVAWSRWASFGIW